MIFPSFRSKIVNLVQLGVMGCLEVCAYMVVLPIIVVLLRCVGFRRTTKFLSDMAPQIPVSRPPVTNNELAWITVRSERIRISGAYGPVKAVCLPKSIFLWFFLCWAGVPSEVRIGVDKVGSVFYPHAWLEIDGVVINDKLESVSEFVVIS